MENRRLSSIFLLITLAEIACGQTGTIIHTNNGHDQYWNQGDEARILCTSQADVPSWQLESNRADLPVNDTSFDKYQIRAGLRTTLVIKNFSAPLEVRCENPSFTARITLGYAVAVSNVDRMPDNVTRTETPGTSFTIQAASDSKARPVSGNTNWTIVLDNTTTYTEIAKDSLIVPVVRTSAGKYTYFLANKRGPKPPLSGTVYVTIYYPPDVSIDGPANNSIHATGSELKVDCRSDANPSATSYNITFTPVGGSRRTLASQADGKYTAPGLLTRADTGWYGCSVTNDVGTRETSVYITVVAPAGMVRNLTMDENSTSSTANLTWAVPADDGGSNITGHNIQCVAMQAMGRESQRNFTTTAETSFRLTGLESGLTYNCSVAAVNFAGSGTPAYITVTTAAGPPCVPKLTATYIGMQNICLSWHVACNGGANLTACHLYRGPAANQIVAVYTVPPAMCKGDSKTYSYCDSQNLSPGMSYYYVFGARNEFDETRSQSAQFDTQTIPTSPTPVATTAMHVTAGKSDSSDSNTGLIVGVVIAVVVVCVIAAVIIIYVVRERGKADPDAKPVTARYTKSEDTVDAKKELNYANVEIQPGARAGASKPAGTGEQTTYASVDAEKTLAAAARTEETGTSTVV